MIDLKRKSKTTEADEVAVEKQPVAEAPVVETQVAEAADPRGVFDTARNVWIKRNK